MHAEELVVGLRRQQPLLGARELGAHQEGFESAEQEERERGLDVADADLLVVDGPQPATQAGPGLPQAGEPLLQSHRHPSPSS